MIGERFLVVGLVRNCAGTVEQDILQIEQSLSSAESTSFFLVESDSSDDSVALLKNLTRRRENIDFVTLGNLSKSHPKRTDRLAHCRNRYLAELRKPKYESVNYVIVADFDGINDRLTASCVQSCWKRSDWDVCCANQFGPYYDIWALRESLWSPNDCWQFQRFLTQYGADRFSATLSAVYSRMISIPSDADWIQVDSAFGGFAIYNKRLLTQSRYVGLNDNGEEICEHVSLHRQIRKEGGRIYINPSLTNADVVGHARNATQFGIVKFWARCQVERVIFSLLPRSTLRRIKKYAVSWLKRFS